MLLSLFFDIVGRMLSTAGSHSWKVKQDWEATPESLGVTLGKNGYTDDCMHVCRVEEML